MQASPPGAPVSSTAPKPHIEVDRLEIYYGNVPAVRGVSFNVLPGEQLTLLGPSGCGKTSTLRCIAGLETPDSGSIEIGNTVVYASSTRTLVPAHRRDIGMVFQSYAIWPHMTVFDNVAFPLRRLYASSDAEVRERVRERLERVSLGGFEERWPRSLSGGQKKRVGVARATVTRAPLVLYDEPAAGLDPVTSQKIFELLRAEQRATSATAVMVSSDLDRLLTVTDRVGMLYKGELIFDGTTDEARSSPEPRVRQFIGGRTDGPL
jgi:phospholipid/cholesterol/gamma-HCH transport system ATP-binding protein